ncbi:outer membrane beta-barrel protein [Pyxidicoccus trucidator]|uniref:outer membrane beta-barrel protein n=1 Tax=Pyxidicoccus trucidator TaxID=2709662 RepID=UPI0013DC62F5|nr:outer membrane beta-barrel protein [Pyxidicoccus trucidator]
MRRFHSVPLMILGLCLLVPAARGADAPSDSETAGFVEQEPAASRFVFSLGGGPSFPISDAGGRFEAGWGFQLGAGLNFSSRLGLLAEYSYSGYEVQDDVLTESSLVGDHFMQYGDLNAIVNLLPGRRLGVYLTGGPGLYYRRVEVTRLDGAEVVPYCDPWLLVCYPDVVPAGTVLGSRSTTDFGLNAGLGVTYRLYGPIRVYLEARYHYIFGPEFDTPEGSRKADGQYLPINLGLLL